MSKRLTCAISLGKSKKGKRTKFGSKSIRNENIKKLVPNVSETKILKKIEKVRL